MSEMKDRVARVIYDALGTRYGHAMVTWKFAPEREWCFETARLVIGAMREPTPDMIEAGWAESLAENAAETWRDMIDGALK